jgi:hypothetical protein
MKRTLRHFKSCLGMTRYNDSMAGLVKFPCIVGGVDKHRFFGLFVDSKDSS